LASHGGEITLPPQIFSWFSAHFRSKIVNSEYNKNLKYFKKILKINYFPTILDYKNNPDMDCSMFLSFRSDLVEEFGMRFKNFAEVGKLSQFLNNPYYEVSPKL